MKFGKTPARLNSVQLKLRDYLDFSALPQPPDNFGHYAAITDYGMFANDVVGDCVWAGAAHEHEIWGNEGGVTVEFTDADVLGDYSAATGFDPARTDPVTGVNPTDGGTDMQVAAAYRQKTGILDASGTRRRIGAYLAVTPDPTEMALAAYLFGAVGVGLRFPDFAMGQFQAGLPWSTAGQYGEPTIVGGHYVPLVGRSDGNYQVVTWGRVQAMTVPFARQFCDEAIVYLDEDILTGGYSPEHFDLPQLQADLRAFVRS